jgi:hypothetical protein
MIERVEPKAPLSLRPPALPARYFPEAPAAPPAGSVMELPLGEIAGDFHAIAGGEGRYACYELLVSNDTPLPVATFAYAAEQNNRHERITWNAILVPPYSAIAVEIDIALPRRGRPPRVVAELHAEDAKLTLDAGPPYRSSRGIARRATLILSAALLLAVGGVSFAKAQPHVVALAAPETVRGGAPFTVAYAIGNGNAADYTVETADGLEVGRGSLHSPSGAFALSLPVKPVSTGYDVRVFAHGRFGTDVRAAHVVALAATAPQPAPPTAGRPLRVTGLALQKETVHGGEAIVVDYQTSAPDGYVRLIDEIGTVRAEALLNRHGRSVVEAPYVDADQDLRVVVDAQAGTSRAEAEVPVRVLRADPTSLAANAGGNVMVPGLAPDSGAVQTVAAANTPASAGSDHEIIAVASIQRPGVPIVVRIQRYEPGLRVAVMGDSGEELEGVDVRAGDATVELPALSEIQEQERLSVVATYAKGFVQDTYIRPITLQTR